MLLDGGGRPIRSFHLVLEATPEFPTTESHFSGGALGSQPDEHDRGVWYRLRYPRFTLRYRGHDTAQHKTTNAKDGVALPHGLKMSAGDRDQSFDRLRL